MEKLEIPAGRSCELGGGSFCVFQDNVEERCHIYGDLDDWVLRHPQCLADHPHGAVIKIENKEG